MYHLKASAGSRSGGSSAGAKYDYIAREGRYARDAAEVRHVESGHMPGWASGRPRSYWAAADAHERANGRLYREIIVALPAELDRREQKALAQQLARDITAAKRLPHTLVIHAGEKREAGEPANPHAHLVWSDRGLDGHERTADAWFRRFNAKAPEKGGARKHSGANGARWLHQVRGQWAERVNQALAENDREERVDHRSLAVRAVEAADAGDMEKAAALAREPNVHLGPAGNHGRVPMRKVELAAEIEERNAVLSRLDVEAARLKEAIARLAGQIKQARQRIEARYRRWEQEQIERRGAARWRPGQNVVDTVLRRVHERRAWDAVQVELAAEMRKAGAQQRRAWRELYPRQEREAREAPVPETEERHLRERVALGNEHSREGREIVQASAARYQQQVAAPIRADDLDAKEISAELKRMRQELDGTSAAAFNRQLQQPVQEPSLEIERIRDREGWSR